MTIADRSRESIAIRRLPAGGYRLEAEQFLPQPRERVFAFFADAFGLEDLTPPWMNFHVLTARPITMDEGLRIDYRLRVRGIPLRWQSLISCWDPPHAFVDEQTRGPYRRWHHQHLFESVAGGTMCRDIVDYAVPGGSVVNKLFVQPELLRIFAYRQQKLRALFAAADGADRHARKQSDDKR